MVGAVSSSPIPVGQGQNNYQQAQARQGAAQSEQRDPRDNEVQRRNEPSAQTQETRAQSLKSPRDDQFNVAANASSSSAQDSAPSGGGRGQEPGSLLNVLV